MLAKTQTTTLNYLDNAARFGHRNAAIWRKREALLKATRRMEYEMHCEWLERNAHAIPARVPSRVIRWEVSPSGLSAKAILA